MRKHPDDRCVQILDAAVNIASKSGGFSKLTRESVAREAQCAEGLVSKYFGTMLSFKRAIVRHAIQKENLSIIAQGLAIGDMHAQKAPKHLKERALQTLAG